MDRTFEDFSIIGVVRYSAGFVFYRGGFFNFTMLKLGRWEKLNLWFSWFVLLFFMKFLSKTARTLLRCVTGRQRWTFSLRTQAALQEQSTQTSWCWHRRIPQVKFTNLNVVYHCIIYSYYIYYLCIDWLTLQTLVMIYLISGLPA